LTIQKGQSESVYRRRTDNTMAKRKKHKRTNNDLQRSTKHTHKTKDRVTRTPLKIGRVISPSHICVGRCFLFCPFFFWVLCCLLWIRTPFMARVTLLLFLVIALSVFLRPLWSWLYGSYNCLCNQCVSLQTLFESRSDEVISIHHYVIKFVSDLRQVCGFLRVVRLPPPI
jgi:hypothetical protein